MGGEGCPFLFMQDKFGIPMVEDKEIFTSLKRDFDSLKTAFGEEIVKHLNTLDGYENQDVQDLKDVIVQIDSLIMKANDKLEMISQERD